MRRASAQLLSWPSASMAPGAGQQRPQTVMAGSSGRLTGPPASQVLRPMSNELVKGAVQKRRIFYQKQQDEVPACAVACYSAMPESGCLVSPRQRA